ncbi:MAG: TRAP transporter large permease [Alteromonadaceae bacterium]|nr:TRAP transporter large permease [Alteromonadaceae bacterium]
MIMLGLFLLLLLLGVPLAFSLMFSGLAFFVLSDTLPVMVAVQRMVASSQSFPLLAVPFFILAGHIMNASGITSRLISFANLLVCWISGGLAHVTIVLSALMGGVSGSAIADAAMQARILGKPMEDSGLPRGFSAAIITVSALITACIPPSIGLILYGYMGNVSIGRLFIAGLIPGALLTVALMLCVRWVASSKRFGDTDKQSAPALREVLSAAGKCKWALLFPVLLIVTIRWGIFTPSEAGAFAVLYAIAVGMLGYRELTVKQLWTALNESVRDIGMIMLIVLAAGIVGYVIAFQQLPQELAQSVSAITQSPVLVLLICLVLLLAIGTLMEGTITVLLLTPILVPVIQSVGIDPVHFGVLLVLVVTFGGTTPPVGIAMYTVCNIMDCSIQSFIRQVWPFYLTVLAVLIVLALVPDIVLFLPNHFYATP